MAYKFGLLVQLGQDQVRRSYTQKFMVTGYIFPKWLVLIQLDIRYDTRCYFNVRSKADMSQLNLPHGTDN